MCYKEISMVKLVDYEIDGNVGIIRLIDPDNFNPLSKESGRQLLEIIENLRDNDTVRALIITGTGKAFSAGGNVKEFKESIENGTPGQLMDDLTKDLYKIALILRKYPKPVISACNGWAVGAGMNLALSCDIVIASELAKFRQSFSNWPVSDWVCMGFLVDCDGVCFIFRGNRDGRLRGFKMGLG